MLATADHPVWALIAPRDGRGGFLRSEFSDPDEMDADFLEWLWTVRQDAGVPFRVISSARDPHGNVGATRSAHKIRPCKAVDLQVENNRERSRVVSTAVLHGCTRIGIYPAHPDGGGGVHLDREESLDQDVMWTRY